MQLTLKTITGDTFSVELDGNCATVLQLKEQIFAMHGHEV